MIEYGLIIALVSVVVIATLVLLGPQIAYVLNGPPRMEPTYFPYTPKP